MRTTLDIDDAVLAAARALARARRVSLGRALSDLARKGLAPAGMVPTGGAFPTVAAVPGHVITDELVERYRDDD